MPQLVLLAALGAGLYAGYRVLARAGQKMAEELSKAEAELRRHTTGRLDEKDLGALEYDPKSGVYKPVRKA